MYGESNIDIGMFVYYTIVILLLVWLIKSFGDHVYRRKMVERAYRNGEYIQVAPKKVSLKPFIIIFIIIVGVTVPLFYVAKNKDNERKVSETVSRYIRIIRGADYDPNSLSNCFPYSYIAKDVEGVDTVLKKYSSLGNDGVIGAWVGGSTVIFEGPATPSHIEKYDVDELHKDIAINYGTDLDIECAYKAYVYYSYQRDGREVGYTVPIICGKIEDKWYILDDSDSNGPLQTAKNLFGAFDKEDFVARQNVIHDMENPSLSQNVSGFVYDTNGRLSDEEKQKVEEYITAKYKETGVRMYIVYPDTDDQNQIYDLIDKEMFQKATSPAMAYCRPASDNKWYVRWSVYDDHIESVEKNYEQIGNAYLINGSVYDRTIHVIDTAYEVY